MITKGDPNDSPWRFLNPQVAKILSGEKTVTRINLPCPWLDGEVITAFQSSDESDKPFALLKIESVKEQMIGDITLEEVKKEGYEALEAFKETWKRLHGTVNDSDVVWAIEFSLLKVFDEDDGVKSIL